MTKNEDIYTEAAAYLFKIPADEVTAQQREDVKTVLFGAMYGLLPISGWLEAWLEKQQDAAMGEAATLLAQVGMSPRVTLIAGRADAFEAVLAKIREEGGVE